MLKESSLVDEIGAVRARYDYDPWGRRTASGPLVHESGAAAGFHQHYFAGASETLSVGIGDQLIAYVWLDPAHPPSEVVLQWNNGSWEHRAYWGANSFPYGVDGTESRRYMGALPAVGGWVRLEVPASVVGLEGTTLNGMAFTLFDGNAKWDHAGKVTAAGLETVWGEDAPPTGATTVDENGAVGPWTWTNTGVTSDFGFTGHYYHAPSTLHLAMYRAYDADLGRWLSRDPIGENGGINLYAYVGNDPVNVVDPLGLDGYLFFDPVGGPNFAEGAGHVGVGVDNGQGGVYRRDAAWDSLGPLVTSPNLNSAAPNTEITVRLPNHLMPDGRMSDDAMRDYMKKNKSGGHAYTYCSNYASDVVREGGWNIPGLYPNGMFSFVQQMMSVPAPYVFDPTKLGSPTQPIRSRRPTDPPTPRISPQFRNGNPGLRP